MAIKRVDPSTYKASTSRTHAEPASTSYSYTEPTIDDHTVGEVLDVSGDDIEASIPRMSADQTLLTSYSTHVVTLI